jgi:AcrR family transcriptional regulator
MSDTDRTITKTRREEHSEATRAALVQAARGLFAERGYAGVPTEEIVRRARVTRGALYHHFAGKQDLFQAVFEQVQEEVGARITEVASAEPRAEKHLEVGCDAFLDVCLEPAVQRIVLLDAPSVLGWEAWHELDERHALGMIRMSLEVAMAEGYLEEQPAGPLAHLLLGALNEAALSIARAEDVKKARAEVGESLARLIEGLKAPAARTR